MPLLPDGTAPQARLLLLGRALMDGFVAVPLLAQRGMFALYAVVGVGVWLLHLRLPRVHESAQPPPASPPCRAAWPPHSARPWLAPCSAQAGRPCRCWRRFGAYACRVDGPRQGTRAADAGAVRMPLLAPAVMLAGSGLPCSIYSFIR
ncbi:hypothetical protein THIX_90496 [Thiomonas sp. X19]|nr:hypothetical protein [Thiomonas sp. X19]SCC95721.1 hypothetical protein THIX_90496 [Thiomonas sp. X19]